MKSIKYWAITILAFCVIDYFKLESIGLSMVIGLGLFLSIVLFDNCYVQIETGLIMYVFAVFFLGYGAVLGQKFGIPFDQVVLLKKCQPWDVEKAIVGFYAGICCGSLMIVFRIAETLILKNKEN